jgi:predicted GNAT family acetyltransferase
VIVTRNSDASHYEIHDGDELLGWIVYRESSGVVTMIHTDIEPRVEGKGVGSELARGALDDVRERGLKVYPLCPFVASFMRRHPEYEDIRAERATGWGADS